MPLPSSTSSSTSSTSRSTSNHLDCADILKTAVSADDLDQILSSAREYHHHQQSQQQKGVTCPRCRHKFQTSVLSTRASSATTTVATGPGRAAGDTATATAPSPLTPSRTVAAKDRDNHDGGVGDDDDDVAAPPTTDAAHSPTTSDSEILRILLLEMAKANLNLQKLMEAGNEMDDLSFGNDKKGDDEDDDDDDDDDDDLGI